MPGLIADHDAHAPALVVKGELVHQEVVRYERPVVQAGFLVGATDDGCVDKVEHARLKMAVEEGVTQHAGVLVARHVEMALQHHAVLGERAGLVAAQHVDGAKVLDGVEALDHNLVAAEVDGALGKAGRYDHGQHLGCESHGYGKREEQGVEQVALGQRVDGKDDGHHDEHQAYQQHRDVADAAVVGRLLVGGVEAGGDAAQLGLCAYARGHTDACPRDDRGAQEGEVGCFKRRNKPIGRGGELFDGVRFAGEGGLPHK